VNGNGLAAGPSGLFGEQARAAEARPTPAIELHALGHDYPDGTPALRNVDLRIMPGEAVAVVGANGAGKSTLLSHLSGLLWPSTGQVCVQGRALTRDSLTQVRRAVGFVFQDADDQLFMPTVHDDVAFGPANQGLSASQVRSRVESALAAVGASPLASRAPYRLSGGEKRAVAIAGVLAMEPSILVLDEPSAGLDPAARRRLITLLASLGQTRIIATHDLDLVLEVCPRVIVLHEGQVQADGAPPAVFADLALLRRCHLEPPLGSRRSGVAGDLNTASEMAEFVQLLIASRRNVAPRRLVDPGPDGAQLARILAAAAAAPDHGGITPWRFVIVPPSERARLGDVFARALTDRDPLATAAQVEAARDKAHRAPLLMLAVARLGYAEPDIPPNERLLSLGCAVQNMLLAAHAMGLACGLASGQAMTSPRLRELFALAEGEVAVCCIAMGTASRVRPARQRPEPAAFVSTL